MKDIILKSMSISAAIIGAVIGAGFITGAEIVRFFSSEYLPSACFLLFLLMTFYGWILLNAGGRYKTQKQLNLCVLGHFSKFFDYSVPVFSFVSLVSMCAALDALAASFLKIDERIPTLSLAMLPLSLFVCNRGVKGVEKLNILLVPSIIIVIFIACCESPVPATARSDVLPILLYAAMNGFLSSPLIIEAGAQSDARSHLPAAIISSLAVSVCVFMIMSKISSGSGLDADLPLLSGLGKGRVIHVIFSIITAFGIVTTLVSSHYPLVCIAAKSPLKRRLNAFFIAAALLFSRVGFYKIVSVVYPVTGAFGLVYLTLVGADSCRALFSVPDGKPFHKGDESIHCGGKRA